MQEPRWNEVKELLLQALPLAAAERAQFMDKVCVSDPALRSELESLLKSSDDMQADYLQEPPLNSLIGAEGTLLDFAAEAHAGEVFAQHFQLVRKLGEGGMGQVWLANQTMPFNRPVAIKLIKAGLYDATLMQRFQAEQQSLAIMDHPAIARVFEAGTTTEGQPYIVMEYVPGLPIERFCDEGRLSIHARIELFMQICDGVQHAHQKAIIHRDLKPANILVLTVDGKPTPRIIDFGLAKIISTGGPISLATQWGSFTGTPGYMSPEQMRLGVHDIDTRTDVYSLGVILYVLLTGCEPFDVTRSPREPVEAMLRKLHEQDPPRPSTRLRANKLSVPAAAAARHSEPKHLFSQLRGDLDCIALKALEKDRERRYATPSELSADLRRYLQHQPILARPASLGYQLRKYARRHRLAVGIAAALLSMLSAFAIVQAVDVRRVTRERDRANRITEFMTQMFRVVDPSEARGNAITAREILDKASKDLESGLTQDPEVQAQMMQVMARTYLNLGLYARAHTLVQRALDSQRQFTAAEDPQILESMTLLGIILDRQGNDPAAEELERLALQAERHVLSRDAPQVLETSTELAVILEHEGRYADAETIERAALDSANRGHGSETAQSIRANLTLGNALWYQGRYAEAEVIYRRELGAARQTLGPDHPDTLSALQDLAMVVASQDRAAAAVPLFREALAASQRVLGPDDQRTARAAGNLADALLTEGESAEAEALHRQELAIWLKTQGPEGDGTLLAQANLAEVILREGRAAEAENLLRATIEAQIRALGPEHPHTLIAQALLAKALNAQARYTEAERVARAAFDIQLHKLGPRHPNTVDTLRELGIALANSNRYAESSDLFRTVIAMDSSTGRGNAWSAWYAFACVAAAANDLNSALQYLQEAVDRGYANAGGLLADDDLKKLRGNPAFQTMIASLKNPT